MNKKILVTKSFLPPLADYVDQIKRVYDNEWLTNRGVLVRELESSLSNFLQLQNAKVLITNNGTIPLQIALKLLGGKGEIITTPFSYVATTASIVWEGCSPIFVDIDPDYLVIDENKIEDAITEKTTCILATHVFGNPCNVVKINQIAEKYKLKVIYDAAHCFNVKYDGNSIFEYGDFSTCSFHATKLFHTGEGGAIFTKNELLAQKAFSAHNFGHISPIEFDGLGINGKISELQAAMGISVLPYMHEILNSRKRVVELYDRLLDFDNLKKMKIRELTQWNFSYYPVIFKSESILLSCEAKLNSLGIFPRRYFYPSLNLLNYVSNNKMPIAESISKSILCLPLYHDLKLSDVELICETINQQFSK